MLTEKKMKIIEEYAHAHYQLPRVIGCERQLRDGINS